MSIVERASKLWESAKALVRAAPTRIAAVAAVVVTFATEIAEAVPADVPEGPFAVAIQVVAFAGAAWQIVRRVTPVAPMARGVTLPDGMKLTVRADTDRTGDVFYKGSTRPR